MQKINSATELRVAILQLESKRVEEEKILKEHFRLAFDSIKPINLIKSTFNEAVSSPELKDSIVNTLVGMTAGYLSKILFERVTKSPFKKLMGTVLMFSIKNIVSKNPETIKTLGEKFIAIFQSKQDDMVNGTGNTQTR